LAAPAAAAPTNDPTQAEAAASGTTPADTEVAQPGAGTDPAQAQADTEPGADAADAGPADAADAGPADPADAGPADPADAAADSTSAESSPENVVTLTSGELSVNVSTEFPQVLEYDLGGSTVSGNDDGPVTTMLINGQKQSVEAALGESSETEATYELTFPDLTNVSMTAEISLTSADTVHFEITDVQDSAENYVTTIEIPHHDLVSVSSQDAGAHVAAVDISVNRKDSGDTQRDITAETAATDVLGSAYLLVNTDEVAVAMETNSIYDQTHQRAENNGQRWLRQVTEETTEAGEAAKELSVWSGGWTYRSSAQVKWGDPANVELPYTD